MLGFGGPKTTLSTLPKRHEVRGAWTVMVTPPLLTLLSGAKFGAAGRATNFIGSGRASAACLLRSARAVGAGVNLLPAVRVLRATGAAARPEAG